MYYYYVTVSKKEHCEVSNEKFFLIWYLLRREFYFSKELKKNIAYISEWK